MWPGLPIFPLTGSPSLSTKVIGSLLCISPFFTGFFLAIGICFLMHNCTSLSSLSTSLFPFISVVEFKMFWGGVFDLELGHYTYACRILLLIKPLKLAWPCSFSEREKVVGLLWACLCICEVIPQSSVFSNYFEHFICSHTTCIITPMFPSTFRSAVAEAVPHTASCTVVNALWK